MLPIIEGYIGLLLGAYLRLLGMLHSFLPGVLNVGGRLWRGWSLLRRRGVNRLLLRVLLCRKGVCILSLEVLLGLGCGCDEDDLRGVQEE